MLPVVNIAGTYNTIPPPLVNTAVPGSTIVHAPYDTVAPSAADVQVENNTRGSSPPPPAPVDIAATSSADNTFSIASGSGGGVGTSSSQTTFLAQLLAQDSSPETQVVLVQYEKLLALSNVKFKPSNALKPSLEPASVFGRILHQDSPAAPVHTTAPQETAPPPQQQPQQAQPVQIQQPVAAPAKPVETPPPPPQAISAYNASVTRQALTQFTPVTEVA